MTLQKRGKQEQVSKKFREHFLIKVFEDSLDKFFNSGVLSERNICRVHSILGEDSSDLVIVQFGQRNSVCDIDSTFFFPLDNDVWWSLVQSDTESFQFVL